MPPWPSRTRFALAVLAGTAAALLLPLLVVVHAFMSLPLRLPDGSPDDGYTHLLVLLLMFWPVLYAVVAMLHAALLYVLVRLGLLRWPVAVGVSAALPGGAFLAAGSGALTAMVLAASFAAGTVLAMRIAVPSAAHAPSRKPGSPRPATAGAKGPR